MRELFRNLLLSCVTIAICGLLGELSFRYVFNIPLFSLVNFRTERFAKTAAESASVFDAELGWSDRSMLTRDGFNTIEYGIRKNGPNTHLIEGAILVVGDSFAAGSEVRDESSWPAQLENIIKQPVLNAGVGGFGTDQIVLRAEKLLPILHPKTIIVGIMADDIIRAKYSIYGRSKPYFTVDQGKLVLHNSSTHPADDLDRFSWLKVILGHSALVDAALRKVAPDFWNTTDKQQFIQIRNDEVDVTCALLGRLKEDADQRGTRLLVSMQYGAPHIMTLEKPPGDALLVDQCSRDVGLQTIDEFSQLKQVFVDNPDKFKKMFVIHLDGAYGHKSPLGNLRSAEYIAAALSESAVIAGTGHTSTADLGSLLATSGDDVTDLIKPTVDIGMLPSSPVETDLTPLKGYKGPGSAYRLSATGPTGEHYLALSQLPMQAGGLYIASLEVRLGSSASLRFQLKDYKDNGVFGVFDLKNGGDAYTRLGIGREIDGRTEVLSDGWERVSVVVRLPGTTGSGVIIVQVLDADGNASFAPTTQAIDIRALSLSRGRATPPAVAGER